MTLVFYISGHGYGHAVRDIEIIKSLLILKPQIDIHFRTTAPRWLFEPLLNEKIKYHERELDFGVSQKTSFSADKRGTYDRYLALMHQKETLIEQEVQFLKNVQPDVILADITPIAFDAAEVFGQKAIAIGNFSWDWIYSDFLNDMPEFAEIIHDIQQSYKKAERLWRIPFYGDMDVFPNVEDVPLVCRKAGRPVQEIRQKIRRDTNSNFVLLGLRMADLAGVNWRLVEKIQGVTFVAVSRDITLKNCLHLNNKDLPFEDVLNACDAVLSKPGYSIVSEVLANRTPMVYIPRQDFIEDPILINGLKELAVAEELSQEQFYAGEWQSAFDRLFDKKQHWADIRTDGADVIAQKLINRLS